MLLSTVGDSVTRNDETYPPLELEQSLAAKQSWVSGPFCFGSLLPHHVACPRLPSSYLPTRVTPVLPTVWNPFDSGRRAKQATSRTTLWRELKRIAPERAAQIGYTSATSDKLQKALARMKKGK